MSNTDTANFKHEQELAMERMRQMNQRSHFKNESHQMPPVPPFVKLQNEQRIGNKNSNNTNSNNPNSRQPSGSMHNNSNSKNNNHNYNQVNKNESANTGPQFYKHEKKDSFLSGFNFSGLKIPILDNIKFDKDLTLILGILLLIVSEKSDKKLLLALLYILM